VITDPLGAMTHFNGDAANRLALLTHALLTETLALYAYRWTGWATGRS
jgi:hypothetical protein